METDVQAIATSQAGSLGQVRCQPNLFEYIEKAASRELIAASGAENRWRHRQTSSRLEAKS